ncbi:MAG TPA: ABC transporter permease [Gemmatimonadaceae bacterium]|jgi:predicted permease
MSKPQTPTTPQSALSRIRRAFRIPVFTKRQLEREMDDEIAFHIEARAERLRREGMSAEEARAEAVRRFGDAESVRYECVDVDQVELRRSRMLTFIDDLRGDVRFAWRSLKRAPGFVAVALTTLVVGIAAITSIFSYMDAIYFAPLPYHDADRVVALTERVPGPVQSAAYSAVPAEVVPFVRQATRSFERIVTYSQYRPSATFGEESVELTVVQVDTAFSQLFDLRPELGHLLSTEEIAGDASAVMISDRLWHTKYGADSTIIGRPLQLGTRKFVIVGVLSVGFRFPSATDAFVPLPRVAELGIAARTEPISVVAKLRPGVSRDQARTELDVVSQRLTSIDSRVYRGVRLIVLDEMVDRGRKTFLPFPTLFLSAGMFVLLIACANVANLFYVRAAERREEMAVRAALGADRNRLIRQALTEGLLVSVAAAILGTLFSILLIRLLLHSIDTSGFPSWFHVTVDLRVLSFAIAITAVVTIAVGLAPAREGTRFDLVRALKGGGSAGASSRNVTRGSKRGLVLQLGFSVALFTTAVLLLRSYQRLSAVDFGYPANKIGVVAPSMPESEYGDYQTPNRLAFVEQIAERAVLLPGVTGVAIRGDLVQLRNAAGQIAAARPPRAAWRLIPDGDTSRALSEPITTRWYVVNDPFFDLMHLHIRQGRNFAPMDAPGSAPVAVISTRVATLLWGTASPIGRTIQDPQVATPLTIVGVVDDVHDMHRDGARLSTDAGITIYTSTRQAIPISPSILFTGNGDLTTARRAIMELIYESDPTLIMNREATLADQFDETFIVTRVIGDVIGAFAASALFLSVIGIYGVVAFGIAQRTREIGIRMALGGTAGTVVRMMMQETITFVGLGLIVGLVLAAAIGPLVKVLLYDITPLDPVTYTIVCVLFTMVALVASFLPARRAARVDPLTALRAE